MHLVEIQQPEIEQIFSRNSTTSSNFLSENEYLQLSRKIVRNNLFTAWIFEECIDLGVFRQKLESQDLNKQKRKLYRTELRYLVRNQDNEMDLEYYEKYKQFNCGCVLKNQRVNEIEISLHYLIALTCSGNLIIVNMKSSTSSKRNANSPTKSMNQISPGSKIQKMESNTNRELIIAYKESLFVRILMCENESDFFYAIDEKNNFYQISLMNGRINNTFYIRNYDLFIGNHEGEKIRLIHLQNYGYLLYSLQEYIFYLEVKNTEKENTFKEIEIRRSHFAKNLAFNLIFSQVNDKIFMIHNQQYRSYYLLFVDDLEAVDSSQLLFDSVIKTFFQISHKEHLSQSPQHTQKGMSNIEEFISRFESKKCLYKSIKQAWQLKLCQLFNLTDSNQQQYYFYYLSHYISYELLQYLTQNQLTVLDLIQVSVIFFIEYNPAKLKSLLAQLQCIITDQKVKVEIWQKIWEYMPFYNTEKEKNDPQYKETYIDICKILGVENEINFLLKEI